MEKNSTHIAAIALAAIMIATGAVYLDVASDEYKEFSHDANAETLRESGEREENEALENESAAYGPREEAIFFGIIGIAYIPIGIWMFKNKANTKKPYVIALIGSAGLLVFYVATRVIDLPVIGLQTDVGVTDVTAKILQGAIVALAGFILYTIARQGKAKKLA